MNLRALTIAAVAAMSALLLQCGTEVPAVPDEPARPLGPHVEVHYRGAPDDSMLLHWFVDFADEAAASGFVLDVMRPVTVEWHAPDEAFAAPVINGVQLYTEGQTLDGGCGTIRVSTVDLLMWELGNRLLCLTYGAHDKTYQADAHWTPTIVGIYERATARAQADVSAP